MTQEIKINVENVKMKGYKAYDKGLICKGKQYAENTVFEEPNAEICESGMHFCRNPFDVLDYYPLVNDNGEMSEFTEVEALDDVKTDDDKKYCTTKMKVGAKLGLKGFIKACIDFTLKITKKDGGAGGNKRYAQLASLGNYAQLASSGDGSVVMCAGVNSRAKAARGSWITLSEWKHDGEKHIPVCVKTERVDGERIKADTFYALQNGEFAEVVK